jgi:hypothetical protein
VGLYERWCESTKEKDKRKHYWTYVEKDGGRDEIRDDLAETIRSHYDRLERIAEDVKRLGYKVASEILSTAMPQTAKGRSGDLGEILATELVEEEIGLRVPVRRLRYKDGRNMAMRGDDFIGAGYDGDGEKLWLLKGEAKSNKALGKDHDHERPQGTQPRQWPLHARLPAVRRQSLLESNDPCRQRAGAQPARRGRL